MMVEIFLYIALIEGSMTGLAVGVGIFLVFAAAAYIAFRLLKRTVKIAIRLAIVGVILLIALVGSISYYWLSSDIPRPRTAPTRVR